MILRAPPTLLLAYLLAATGRAQSLDVEVTRLDGQLVRGALVEVAPQLVIRTDGAETAIAWTELLAVRPLSNVATTAAAEKPGELRFQLADDSLFTGQVENATERDFVVRFLDRYTCRLELSSLRSVVSLAAAEPARRKLADALARPDAGEDTAVVARGQDVLVLGGVVRRIDEQQVIFGYKGQDRPLPWPRVAGLVFARPATRSAAGMVHLRSGDRFAGRVIAGDSASVTIQSGVFHRLAIPWDQVERIESRSERVVLLSDVAPLRYDFVPLLDHRWPYALDRSLTGQPLRLGGRVFAKGVAMHSRSSLTYRLGGGFRQFAATAGILDEMDARGDVTLRVLVDGKERWAAEHVRGGQPPQNVLVDLRGAEALTLEVDFGDDLDLSDHACWGLARFIR
jgi:hypothetical protein